MTKLEQEMFDVICETDYSIAAAEVAKKYIEKAFHDGYYALAEFDPEEKGPDELKQEWLKENGITA